MSQVMTELGSDLIERSLAMSRELCMLADQSDIDCDDDGCAVLLGIIRDCAYKIRGRAEQEREVHRLRGHWDGIAAMGAGK